MNLLKKGMLYVRDPEGQEESRYLFYPETDVPHGATEMRLVQLARMWDRGFFVPFVCPGITGLDPKGENHIKEADNQYLVDIMKGWDPYGFPTPLGWLKVVARQVDEGLAVREYERLAGVFVRDVL